MADLFWAFSTSYLWMSIIGVVLLAALVVGYFPLAKYLPVIGPYVEAAKLIAFLLFGLLAFLIGHRIADESADLKTGQAGFGVLPAPTQCTEGQCGRSAEAP